MPKKRKNDPFAEAHKAQSVARRGIEKARYAVAKKKGTIIKAKTKPVQAVAPTIKIDTSDYGV